MTDIEEITRAILAFRDERDWAQYHTGKDIAMCLSVEAGELLELFLWKKDGNEVDTGKLRAELADVFYSAFLLAAHYGLDAKNIVLEKLESNKKKYPVEKAKGRNEKYDAL
ncbi:MAG: nucleotide pyrophosphohydrolase [Phaeodactylibacter sp.]|nr:nucleotide pyrophosphohydrolase [Phaeodactylibacter sp.]